MILLQREPKFRLRPLYFERGALRITVWLWWAFVESDMTLQDYVVRIQENAVVNYVESEKQLTTVH